MNFIRQSFAHVASTTIMATLVGCAYVTEAKNYLTLPAKPAQVHVDVNDSPSNVNISVSEYADLYGYLSESHKVTTEDGFILCIDRIYSRNPMVRDRNKGPILIMHGLFQSSGVFVTSGVDSLAFVLADAGFDVWLGNNRCVEKRHDRYKTHQHEFWDWSIDELAKYDFPSLIDYVLQATESEQLVYIGHSQGTSQAFLGLHFNSQISSKIRCFVALAPALYIGPLLNQAPLSLMVNSGDDVFWTLFGTKEFVPLMNEVQKIAPASVFCAVAYQMFHYLFNWTDTEWNKSHKHAYFHFTPRPTSTKALLHWFQIARNGKVLRPFVKPPVTISKHSATRIDSGTSSIILETDTFDLSCIKCPLAILYGQKDKIVDAKRLISECTADPKINLLMAECIEDYEHMDVVWGRNAKEKVFHPLIRLLE